MRKIACICIISLLTASRTLSMAADSPAAPKITYMDHVLPALRNACLNCHNPDKKKGNLDLSTYAGLMAGGGSGKAIEPGDPDGSTLYKVMTWAIEPNMPPKGDKLPEKDLSMIKNWIAAGAPETSGSKVVINKPKNDLSVVAAVVGKPTGPVAMPKGLASEPVVVTKRAAAATAIASSPWAPVLAIGGQKQIVLYHAQSLELLGVLAYPEGVANVLKFSRNGSLLLAGGGVGAKSGRVVVFDVATGKRVAEIGEEYDAVMGADISPDQSQVALGTPLRTVKVYSTSDGSLVHTMKKHTDWVLAAAYSPDGSKLATADRAGGLVVWDAKSGNELHNLTGHKDAVTDCVFRGDSTVLASASQDGTIRLWGMEEGKMIKSISAHPIGVTAIAFTHDGRIASCGREGAVKIWAADGSPVKSFEPFSDVALKVSFNHDGTRVIAGDYTGGIRLWDVVDGKRAGELTANPPPLAKRIADLEASLPVRKAQADKAGLVAVEAQKALDGSKQASKAAAESHNAAVAALASAQSKLTQITKKVTDDAAAAKAGMPQFQAQVEAAASARQKAKAAHTAAQNEFSAAKTKLAQRQAAAGEAAKAAKTARDQAAAKPGDTQLAAAADAKVKAAMKAGEAQQETEKQVTSVAAALKTSEEAANRAEAQYKSAVEAVAAARVASRQTAEASPQIAAAKAAVAKAKTDADTAGKLVAARSAEEKVASEKLIAAQAAAKSASDLLSGTAAQLQQLKAR